MSDDTFENGYAHEFEFLYQWKVEAMEKTIETLERLDQTSPFNQGALAAARDYLALIKALEPKAISPFKTDS